MPKYDVDIPEVHYVHIEVEAEDEDEALKEAKFEYGLLNFDPYLEFSHTLPDSEWKIQEQ